MIVKQEDKASKFERLNRILYLQEEIKKTEEVKTRLSEELQALLKAE